MWKSTHRMLRTPRLTAAAALISFAAVMGAPAWAAETAAAPAATEAAVWTPKEIDFTYMGFTTHYTCDGLRDTVRDWLLQLGARKSDLKVTEQPCSGNPDRPNPFPGVRVKMSVLTPAPGTPDAGNPSVSAYWKAIKLPHENGINAAGQCELLEQLTQKILPLFTTRNVDLHAGCVPHQLEPIGTNLKAEVLVTDQKKVEKQASAAEAR